MLGVSFIVTEADATAVSKAFDIRSNFAAAVESTVCSPASPTTCVRQHAAGELPDGYACLPLSNRLDGLLLVRRRQAGHT
jgi:hypothetical protein